MANWFNPSLTATTTTATAASTMYWYVKHATGGTAVTPMTGWVDESDTIWPISESLTHLLRGRTYTLPDNSEIAIDADGNWKVTKDGGIQYRAANIRNFNKFLNASDLLEAFIRDCGALGVRQNEFLKVPIEAFINWLIFKAAEADGEESPVPKLPAAKPVIDRCCYCKRFLPVRLIVAGVNFCNGAHLTRFTEREQLA